MNPRMPTRRALDIVAIGLAVLVAACAPAATETPAPTATSSPLASASGLSPDLAFEVWTTTFEDAFAGWSDLLADAVEADYDWIESVDRVGYDATANRIVLIVTVPTEEALIADGDAWRSTTWPVFRDVGEVVWAGLVDEATADGGALSTFADWPRWTPDLAIDAGRLTATCPGSLVYAISQGEGTETDFGRDCAFAP